MTFSMGKPIVGLSEEEHKVMQLTAELWNALCKIVPDGASRHNDLNELSIHIHGIQHAVMAQAAGRAHPELYRMLGKGYIFDPLNNKE